MKKRILSLILALSMVLSVLPLGAFAADPPELVMGANGLPVYSEGTVGHNWVYMNGTLCLLYGTFDFSSTHPQNTSAGTQTAPPVACPIEIESDAEITGGIFEKAVTNNGGTIYDGTFNTMVENNVVSWGTLGKIVGGAFNGTVTNKGTISGGAFNATVTNNAGGKISGGAFQSTGSVTNYGTIENGTFNGTVTNSGTIKKGTFNGEVTNDTTAAIENGTFNGTVTNNNTISGGFFEGTVTNSGTISGGTFQNGCSVENYIYIENGTFYGSVKNYSYIENGTFEGTVTNDVTGYITGGTFQSTCSVTNTGIIKDGIFTIKVENGGIGEIFGGIFAAGLSKKSGNVAGGVFNGKTGLDGVTGLHSITWDAASSKAKIVAVNDVSAVWDPYAYKDTTVTITADTEIYSLNGKSIDDGNCKSSYDGNKNTVKFTMPGENVVLNRTAELKVVGGEIESGETAKGSGRVLIGGKVEVTTKDKTQDFVGWTIAPEGIELRDDDGREVDLTSEWTFSFMMPDVSGGKLTLTANYQPFRTSLLMNADGTVNLEHVNHETYDGNEICKGDGWNVFNRGTLILEKWTYDFQYTAPTEKTGTLEAVTCGVRNKGGTIENGVFRNIVLNEVGGTITGGTFAAGLIEVPGMTGGSVTGGVFNGKTGLTNAHHVTVTDGSVLKVNGEDPLKVDETTGAVTTGTAWDLYVYAGTTVTITADTEIFSLNGQPIGAGNCNSSYGSGNNIVTFTMPDENVVLSGAITCTNLVMKGGYPEASNGGTTPCKGNGWTYSKKDTSNPKGKLTLTDGTYDFSYTYPQNSNGAGAEPVACAVETQLRVKITGGTFEGEVINNDLGVISGGTFHEKVSNSNGMITGGTFKSSVTSKGYGRIFGGVFNGNATLTNVTGLHSITVASGAKIKEVNGMSADWDPYVVVTENATTNEVIITADTEIFSLNGQPIGAGNCNSSYGSDKTTVTFTMPDDDVVLNKAITSTDLVMENGWPKDSNGGKNPCKGDGWEYIKNDPTNGDMLLLTDGLFDFSTIGDGSAVKCNVFVGKPTAITGGEFNGKVFNNSGILGGTFHGEVDNMGPGRIVNGTFKNSVENNGMIENAPLKGQWKTTPTERSLAAPSRAV